MDMEMANPNHESGFPHCPDGDVVVTVSISRYFRMHSRILRQAEYFRNIFETSIPTKLTAQARRDGSTPYRFVLIEYRAPEGRKQHLVHLQVSENGKFQRNPSPRDVEDDLSGHDPDKYWDWLFGSFYGIEPEMESSTCRATAADCVKLLDVADVIGADVRKIADLNLMRQDETLWKSVANNPIIWAGLGRRIQSPSIFREAIIHIIGQWKLLDPEDREQLDGDTFDLCQTKWDELELAKRAVEIRIAGHYPPCLYRNHADKPHRTAYSNDIYMWMALSLFRHHVAQSGIDCTHRTAADGGYSWFKKFHDGGNTYLDHDALRNFHSFFPMSSKAVGVMEQHMNVLKEDIKVFVKELMINRTHVDPATINGVTPWLTCAVIENDDLPWKVVRDSGETNE